VTASPKEHGNETWDSIKGCGLLDQLSEYQLLKDDFVAWNYSHKNGIPVKDLPF
jgi:hypothetical protein